MKFLRLLLITSVVICGAGTSGLAAGRLPTSIVTSPSLTPADLAAINALIVGDVANLANGANATAQQQARDALINEVEGVPNPSVAFVSAYATSLNNNVLPLAKNPSMRVRLNAAIAVAHIAARADNTALMPATTAFVQDSYEAVVLSGMEAAKYVVPAIYRIGGPVLKGNALVPAVKAAVKAHPGAPVAGSAYEVISDSYAKTLPPADLVDQATVMMDLLEARLEVAKVRLPGDLQSEKTATLYLSVTVFQSLPAASQLRAVKLMSDLLGIAAQRLAGPNANVAAELVPVLQQTAASLWVIGQSLTDANIKNAAQPLIKLQVNTPAAQVLQLATNLYNAIIANPQFKNVPPAPTIQAGGAAAPAGGAAPPATTQPPEG